MMGIRPLECCTAMRISSLCSSKLTVGDSPVVPTTTMPSVPSATCQSMSCLKRARSSRPSSCIGVMIATRLPVIMGSSRSDDDSSAFYVISNQASALNHGLLRPLDRPLLERHHRQRAESVQQLSRAQQKIGIRRLAVLLVAHHEGLVDQHCALVEG